MGKLKNGEKLRIREKEEILKLREVESEIVNEKLGMEEDNKRIGKRKGMDRVIGEKEDRKFNLIKNLKEKGGLDSLEMIDKEREKRIGEGKEMGEKGKNEFLEEKWKND